MESKGGLFSKTVAVTFEGRTYQINEFGLSNYAQRHAREYNVTFREAMMVSVRYWVWQEQAHEAWEARRAAKPARKRSARKAA